jgi:hydrogenase expression/formation protein HypE
MATTGMPLSRSNATTSGKDALHGAHQEAQKNSRHGVATALWELAQAAGVGLHIAAEHLPLLPEGALLCEAFSLDPPETIASGALLAAVPAAQAERAIAACCDTGIACHRIGIVVANSAELLLRIGTETRPIPTFPQDEMVKIFHA